MPGAGFKVKAARWRKEMNDFLDAPFNEVKSRMVSKHPGGTAALSYFSQVSGTQNECVLTSLLHRAKATENPSHGEDRAKYAAAVAFLGEPSLLRPCRFGRFIIDLGGADTVSPEHHSEGMSGFTIFISDNVIIGCLLCRHGIVSRRSAESTTRA